MQSRPQRLAQYVQKQFELERGGTIDDPASRGSPPDVVSDKVDADRVSTPTGRRSRSGSPSKGKEMSRTPSGEPAMQDYVAFTPPEDVTARPELQIQTMEPIDKYEINSFPPLPPEQSAQAQRLNISEAEYASRLGWDRQNVPEWDELTLSFKELHDFVDKQRQALNSSL